MRSLLAAAFITGASVLAMSGSASGQAPPSPSAGTPQSTTVAKVPVAPDAVEPQGYTYNPDGRRDPFVSLLRRGADAQRLPAGSRPAGLAGLEASEVTLKGTLQSRDGYVGILQGADNKTYIVRPGDRLLDGSVRTITAGAVVILQQVNDPLSLQKQREVRKVLRETEEAR